MFCFYYLAHLGIIHGGALGPCGSLLPFCPTFLSFLEFTLKNLFAWAGSSFISWHATKELFFSLFFFSLSFPGHDGVARCQYYSRSTMMFDMKEKKENFRRSLFCQCQLWSFKLGNTKSNILLRKKIKVSKKIEWWWTYKI